MFALIAAICFLLALLGVGLGSIDMTVLGLFFVALHLLIGIGIPTPWRRQP